RAGWQGDALGELAAVQLVAQAQHPAHGVDGVVAVAEDLPARCAHRAPPGRNRATRAKRPQGRAVRSLKKWPGSGPVGMSVVWTRGPGTPAWQRAWRLAAQRSSSQRPGADGSGRMNSAAAEPKVRVTASWTSGPTWYRSAPMAGPIPAVTSAGQVPRRRMAARAAAVTPATVPRQPACTQASTPATGSCSTTGTQSAVKIASTTPGEVVTSASAPGMASSRDCAPLPRSASATTATPAPCTWRAKTKSPGAAPNAVASRCRFSSTQPGSSPTLRLRFSDSYGPDDTPPARAVTAAPAPEASRAGQVSWRRSPAARNAVDGGEVISEVIACELSGPRPRRQPPKLQSGGKGLGGAQGAQYVAAGQGGAVRFGPAAAKQLGE